MEYSPERLSSARACAPRDDLGSATSSLTTHEESHSISAMCGRPLFLLLALSLLGSLPGTAAGTVESISGASVPGASVDSVPVDTRGAGTATRDGQASTPAPRLPTVPSRVASRTSGSPPVPHPPETGGDGRAAIRLPGPALPAGPRPALSSPATAHPVTPAGDRYARPPPVPMGYA